MEITDERTGKRVVFEELSLGDVFEYEDEFFMKIEESEYKYGVRNAVNIEDGALYTFCVNEQVTPLVVQLRIIRND